MILFLAVLSIAASSASGSESRFSYGYAHFGDAVPKEFRTAAIDRLSHECAAIAERLFGIEICEDLKVEVRWSDVNTNGFETWFKCQRSLEFAIGRARLSALHDAIGSRYEDLIACAKNGHEVLPLSEFLAKYDKKG